jgi:hypothetical protein
LLHGGVAGDRFVGGGVDARGGDEPVGWRTSGHDGAASSSDSCERLAPVATEHALLPGRRLGLRLSLAGRRRRLPLLRLRGLLGQRLLAPVAVALEVASARAVDAVGWDEQGGDWAGSGVTTLLRAQR